MPFQRWENQYLDEWLAHLNIGFIHSRRQQSRDLNPSLFGLESSCCSLCGTTLPQKTRYKGAYFLFQEIFLPPYCECITYLLHPRMEILRLVHFPSSVEFRVYLGQDPPGLIWLDVPVVSNKAWSELGIKEKWKSCQSSLIPGI